MGPEIGRFDIDKAKEYMKVTSVVAFVLIALSLVIFILFAEPILSIFTKKPDVLKEALAILPWFCAAIFPDLWQGFIQGIIKALGIQEKVAVINFLGYWVLNIPLCWLFAFHFKIGFAGIW